GYQVTGDDGSIPITLDVYRSDSDKANKGKQVNIAEVTLRGQDATTGAHEITITQRGFTQTKALRPDPTHPFVLVTADENGALNPADKNAPPQANFRIWLIGAVTHGYTNRRYVKGLIGPLVYQGWVDDMAK